MVQPTERMFALAERGLPVQHRPGHVTDKVTGGGGPLAVYTDGSVSGRRIANGLGWMTGWGYLDTGGTFGCGKMPQFLKTGDDPAVVAELRAVWHAVGQRLATTPCTVIADSTFAIRLLTSWREGSTDMPPGYTGRTAGGIPKLELLVAAHPDHLTVATHQGPRRRRPQHRRRYPCPTRDALGPRRTRQTGGSPARPGHRRRLPRSMAAPVTGHRLTTIGRARHPTGSRPGAASTKRSRPDYGPCAWRTPRCRPCRVYHPKSVRKRVGPRR